MAAAVGPVWRETPRMDRTVSGSLPRAMWLCHLYRGTGEEGAMAVVGTAGEEETALFHCIIISHSAEVESGNIGTSPVRLSVSQSSCPDVHPRAFLHDGFSSYWVP